MGAEYVVSQAPAAVLKILKSVGDPVKAGEPLVVNEAMKMETTLTASMDGTVESIHVKPGQQIDKGKVLIKIKPSGEVKDGDTKEGSAKASLELPPSRLQLLSESESVDAAQAMEALGAYERFFDGYTAPLGLLKRVLLKLEPTSESGPQYKQAVEGWATGLLKRYKAVEAVFQPAYQRQWGYFLKTGKVEDSRFESVLKTALQLYGVDSLEATPARDAAVKRLYQSHEQSEGKRELLGILLQWIPKHEMNSLREVLAGVSRLFADQGQTPFLTQVEETVARLREKGSDREYLQKLEEEFAKIVGMNRNSRENCTGTFTTSDRRSRVQTTAWCSRRWSRNRARLASLCW
ncbi:MAG: HlyD family secretion protein [Deltaproteobacteria bacterium]|nr:HlyD family secretion protein [Deltaproteobacteria bacterium]